MSRSLFEEHGVYPTQDGGVVVLLGSVAEVLSRPDGLKRLAYAEQRYNEALHAHTHGKADPSWVAMCASRVMAYQAALAHEEKRR